MAYRRATCMALLCLCAINITVSRQIPPRKPIIRVIKPTASAARFVTIRDDTRRRTSDRRDDDRRSTRSSQGRSNASIASTQTVRDQRARILLRVQSRISELPSEEREHAWHNDDTITRLRHESEQLGATLSYSLFETPTWAAGEEADTRPELQYVAGSSRGNPVYPEGAPRDPTPPVSARIY